MESSISKKVSSLLGFCAKARKIVSGYNTVIMTIEKGKAKLVIIAADTSDNSKEKIISLAKRSKVEFRIYGKSEDLSHITGKSLRSIFAITDDGFSKSILKEIDFEPNIGEN